MKNLFKRRKLNNDGASLVMVVVIVTFISILATIILYAASTNYITKMTDRKNKESFYTAETAMEEIKAALYDIAAEAASEAYVDTMVHYSVEDNYTRYTYFRDHYFEEFEKIWNKKLDASSGSNREQKLTSLVQSFVENAYYESDGTVVSNADYDSCVSVDIIKDPVTGGYIYDADSKIVTLDKVDINDGYVFLRNVQVVFVKDNFTSVIKTDFVFTVPEMNWAVNQSYKEPSSTSTEVHGSEIAGERREYDIAEYVNYYNWQRN